MRHGVGVADAGDVWPSNVSIGRLPPTLPVLFLSGAQDELVPPAHMKQLHAMCSSKITEFHSFKDGMHSAWARRSG